MARTWLVDSRGLAKKVKNAGVPAVYQIQDCGASRECPNCQYCIDNTDVSHVWPGFPAGVKFDPSDSELLEHLAAKCGVGDSEPHMFIDEFIPTLEDNDGICYTHPENLPGARKDGSSVHFFYRITNAYSSGQRKRRKIRGQERMMDEHVRWHKTGKTKLVMENVLKGFKKIMVLYATSSKGSKPDRCHWVMHQYHLGSDEDEKDGEFVVSKIFYQMQKQNDKNETSLVNEESYPKTPKTTAPGPPRPQSTPSYAGDSDDYLITSFAQRAGNLKELSYPPSGSLVEDEVKCDTCLAGESQIEFDGLETLFCNEIMDSSAMFGDLWPVSTTLDQHGGHSTDIQQKESHHSGTIIDLENIELDTSPDFQLSDLQFASQDSVFNWLNQF